MKHRRLWFPTARMEVRAEGDGAAVIEGYGAVFDSPSVDFGGWREIIDPGAFTRTLNSGRNVFSFVNHDPEYVLGRTDNESLTLAEDQTGLRFQVTPPATTWASDLLVSMRRGDISGASFMFDVVSEVWEQAADGVQERHLTQVRLYECGPVTMPAYPAADSGVRSRFGEGVAAAAPDLDVIVRCLGRQQAGIPIPKAERDLLEQVVEAMRGIISTAGPVSDPPQAGHSLDMLQRQLDALTI